MHELQRHQPRGAVTARDLVRVQENVAKTLADMQTGALEFVSNAPATSTSPGKRGQAYFGTDGNLYICLADNSWARFQGVTFP